MDSVGSGRDEALNTESGPRLPSADGGRPLPSRHIHLDFHNSAEVGPLAQLFEPDAFAQTMADSAVESVNVFAKCHHGFSYYPSDVGEQHPGLDFDLLGAQIDALHARGLRAPIYYSVLWDDRAGELHGDWIVADADGALRMRKPLSNDSAVEGGAGWTTMDVGSGYGDYVLGQVRELCTRYDPDGFWFDIVWPEPNYSPSGRARARARGVDISDPVQMQGLAREVLRDFLRRLLALIEELRPGASVFFNGLVDADLRRNVEFLTHVEIESLPTSATQWGYLHYPYFSHFARTFDLPILGMTGRFHRSWADFGGLKRASQLTYEVTTIHAAGGAVCVGDQLDPSGRLDPAVYRTIGTAYRYLASLEPFTAGRRRKVEAAILGDRHSVPRDGNVVTEEFTAEVEGAAQVFLELGVQFDIVDPETDRLSEYSLVVVPSGYSPSDAVAGRLAGLLDGGAAVLTSGTAGLNTESGRLEIGNLDLTYTGPVGTVPSYLTVGRADGSDPELAEDYPYAFYDEAHTASASPQAEPFGTISEARFNRTWRTFTSHAQAPVGRSLDTAIGYFGEHEAHLCAPLFSGYRNHGYWVYRSILEWVVDRLLPDRIVRVDGPGWVEVSAFERGSSTLIELVAYQSLRSPLPVPRVDDPGTISGLELDVRVPARPSRVYLAPAGTDLPFRYAEGRVVVAVDGLTTHALVVIEQ